MAPIDDDDIIGDEGFGHDPVVLDKARGDLGEATNLRRALILPPTVGGRILSAAPSGHLERADLPTLETWKPVICWWHAVSTEPAGALAMSTVNASSLVITSFPEEWKSKALSSLKHRCRVENSPLTAADFTAGLTGLRHTLESTTRDSIHAQQFRSVKVLADKHKETLTAIILRFCGVADEEHLPTFHKLANAPKNREHAVLGAAVSEGIRSFSLNTTEAAAPIVSSKLLDRVFRNFNPGGTGLIFGEGLTPFSIVSNGHNEMNAIQAMIQKATMVEGGNSISLSDASALMSTDIRFPSDPQVAFEKLNGWSNIVDIFHGINQPIVRQSNTSDLPSTGK